MKKYRNPSSATPALTRGRTGSRLPNLIAKAVSQDETTSLLSNTVVEDQLESSGMVPLPVAITTPHEVLQESLLRIRTKIEETTLQWVKATTEALCDPSTTHDESVQKLAKRLEDLKDGLVRMEAVPKEMEYGSFTSPAPTPTQSIPGSLSNRFDRSTSVLFNSSPISESKDLVNTWKHQSVTPPTFNAKLMLPEEFLHRFTTAMRLSRIDPGEWIARLQYYLPAIESSWFHQSIVQQRVSDWNQVCELFILQFEGPNEEDSAMSDLMSIRQRLNETASDYELRFNRLLMRAKIAMDDKLVNKLFIKSVRPEFREPLVVRLAGELSIPKAQRALREIEDLHLPNSRGERRRTREDTPYMRSCKHCNKRNHSSEECFHRNTAKRVATPSTDPHTKPDDQRAHPTVKCNKCGQFGHYANKCKSGNPKTVYSISKDEPNPNRDVRIPLSINGNRILAHLDTQADISCLSTSTSRRLELETTGFCEILVANSLVPQRVPTANVDLLCNDRSFVCEVAIVDLLNKEFLLGKDKMYLCGIKIEGIPLHYTTPNEDNVPVENFAQPIPVETSDLNNQVLNGVKELLDLNQKVDRSIMCSLDYAVVELNTGSAPPINRRQYPIAQRLLPQVREVIDQWIGQKTIKKAPPGTQWNQPLLVAPKKDVNGLPTKVRICLDTRGLNSLLQDEQFTLPLVSDVFQTIGGFQLATRLDLEDSFNQLPIKESDQIKTTFTFERVRYMFCGAPFGIKTLSAHLQRVLDILLHRFQAFMIHFIDDIIIFSQSVEDHIHHLKLVIAALTSANLKLRAAKCLWACTELELLGHIVSATTIRPDPSKLAAFQNIPLPQTGKELESFLGVVGYLREFIPSYSKITSCLEKIRKTKGNLNLIWSSEHSAAVDTLKAILASPPFLTQPDWDLPFYVGTDASNSGIGAVLYQKIDGKPVYIAMMSKALTRGQKNYPATKKELLAIVRAVTHFRHWLWGRPFEVFTDHMSLVYLFSNKSENTMLTNWADTLLDYNFTITHCPGISHILPDYLSRIYEKIAENPELHPKAIHLVKNPDRKPSVALSQFVRQVLSKTVPSDKTTLLHRFHELNHQGPAQLFSQLFNEGLYWPEMRHDCDDLVRHCKPCISYNVSRMGYHPLQPITASLPMDHIALDLLALCKPLPRDINLV